MFQLGKRVNIHTTAFFLSPKEPAFIQPFSGWKAEGQSPTPVGYRAYFEKKGPFKELSPGGHPIMPNTLLLLSSSLAVLLSTSNVCAMISRETGISWPFHLKLGPLSRAGGLPLYQQPSGFNERLASTAQLAVSSSLMEARFSSIL